MNADLRQIEGDLWEAADQLRANSKLTSTEYCMPVLGIIFLRHAANRFNAATDEIEADQEAGRMPRRPIFAADYTRRRALWLPEISRYEYLANLTDDKDLGQELNKAMLVIEESSELLTGVLPKEYGIFEQRVLEDLVRIFDREFLRSAGGDVFGRIYEYFLMKFAMQGAQDNGEFFTPPSLVQTIVNVIEPDHGTVLDPACGSGGMFVQSSHFIENQGQDTAHKVTFFGQEKTATTIKLAKMNLAVHGLEGDIREANTFYDDAHGLYNKCDFVMANPPFNVDMVSAEVRSDKRLPFGLPGENKDKNVPNGNYLWISYFYSYLNAIGRAGFVMSSQASSAGNKEKDVREKIVKTGHVDAMISIRSGFFYTRTVPCELWFFDKGKPEHLRDKVLMLDARNIHRKVTRTVYDFSPEQLANLTSIVWLYRGQNERFLDLIKGYFGSICSECAALPEVMDAYSTALQAFCTEVDVHIHPENGGSEYAAAREAIRELAEEAESFQADKEGLLGDVKDHCAKLLDSIPDDNAAQHAAREAYAPIVDRLKALAKAIDHLHKLAQRTKDALSAVIAGDIAGEGAGARGSAPLQGMATIINIDLRAVNKILKELDARRQEVVTQLRQARYFYKQILLLQERFPDAEYRDVPGLCKLATLAEIEDADWSLTPGRYVGVAPVEEDEGFDFEEALLEIHTELAGLNEESVELAAKIQANFEELTGV